MDGQHDTRGGSSSRPVALLKIPSSHMGLQYARWTQNFIILTGEDNIARFNSRWYSKYVVRVVLSFGPLAPRLAALTTVHLSDSRTVPLALSFETLGLPWASALPDQPPPPNHLKNHLIWVDSIMVIPLACCRMSFECLAGTRRFPTTFVTLPLQLWNYVDWFCTGVLKVRHPCLILAFGFYELFSLLEKQKESR